MGSERRILTFTPHLLPIPRGILSTIYVRFTRAADAAQQSCMAVPRIFTGRARWCVCTERALPQIQYSVRTNYADIGFQVSQDGRRAVIVSCLDNLLKGAAGQAVQNLNVMQGWDEAEGLE